MSDRSVSASGSGSAAADQARADPATPAAPPEPSTRSSGTGYPPEQHFLRDLDSSSWHVSRDRLVMSAPVTDGVRNAAGAAALGFLTALVDIAGAPVALVAGDPDWTATQDLTLHATGWLTEGPAAVDAHVQRVGRNTVIVAVDVYDGHGTDDLEALAAAIDAVGSHEPATPGAGGGTGASRTGGGGTEGNAGPAVAGGAGVAVDPATWPTRVATGLLTFARIPRSASAAAGAFDPTAMIGQRRSMSPPGPVVGTMLERIGIDVVDAAGGVVEVHRHDYVRNSFGTINGGVLGAVFQAAAEAARPGMVATDVQIHYLAQVQEGPARTSVEVSRDAGDHTVVTARAVDAGHGDLLLDLATVVLQRPPA